MIALINPATSMSKLIPLTKGHFAIVDDEDFERLKAFRWHAKVCNGTCYAIRSERVGGRMKTVPMHREIFGAEGMRVDHRNRNGLDNRRENLRHANASQNGINRGPQKNNTSGFKGVCFDKSVGKWLSKIKKNGRAINLGRFDNPKLAAAAYDKKAIELHGEFAVTNLQLGLLC